MPPGAWDCHTHVFGRPDKYGLSPTRRYTPGLAEHDDLARMLDHMGIDRVVLVQPSPYGGDHACLADALAALGQRAVAVGCFPPGERMADGAIERLGRAGMRGLRVQATLLSADETRAAVLAAAAQAAELGWHLELHVDRLQFPLLRQHAARLGVPIVLDHMAHLGPGDLPALAALMEEAEIYTKISGLYRLSNPREALATAQAIATRFPQRCLWGSDWPHTPPHPVWQGAPPPPSPFRPVDAGALFDTFFSGIDAALRHMILCEVPARLYGGNVGSKAVEGAGR
ncbi:MAG: amidohydrolase family protein [Nitratireductor sp.]|nr:amidohydrolase family protein [Nitratireductor sp.]